MFVKIEETVKLDEKVRLELMTNISENTAALAKLGYRFDMSAALDEALDSIEKQQRKFIGKLKAAAPKSAEMAVSSVDAG